MRLIILTSIALLAIGCAPPEREPEAPTETAQQRATRVGNERSLAGIERRNAATNASIQASERRASEERAAKQSAIRALDADCATDRVDRAALASRYRARADREREVKEWRAENCTSVDRSKPVVRTVQDSQGRIFQQEGRDRGVDVECPKKDPNMPPEAAPGYAWPPLPAYTADAHDRAVRCRQSDARAGADVSMPVLVRQ